MADLLNVEHLSVSFFTPAGEAQAVRDVSFSLKAGEVLAIVGESGCGKSVLCKSILRLLPQTAKIKSGKIIVDGTDITAYREREMKMCIRDRYRSENAGMSSANAVRICMAESLRFLEEGSSAPG